MAKVEVYKMLGFWRSQHDGVSIIPIETKLTMSHETAKIAANNAMPCSAFLCVELQPLLAQARSSQAASCVRTSLLICCAMSCDKGQRAAPLLKIHQSSMNLFNSVFLHGFLRYHTFSHCPYFAFCCCTRSPISIASCCISSLFLCVSEVLYDS